MEKYLQTLNKVDANNVSRGLKMKGFFNSIFK